MLELITTLEAERDHWKHVAEHDELTGLYNRRGLANQTADRTGYYVYCDLNNFKQAQDASPLKHAYGDGVLREFRAFCEDNTRKGTDRVSARVGGDEFVIWCPTLEGAGRIRSVVRNWTSRDGQVGCAAGMGKTLAAADSAMYVNKSEMKS